jgi:hypothetical protein
LLEEEEEEEEEDLFVFNDTIEGPRKSRFCYRSCYRYPSATARKPLLLCRID